MLTTIYKPLTTCL